MTTPARNGIPWRQGLVAIGLAVAIPACGSDDSRLPVYPVKGQVELDREPPKARSWSSTRWRARPRKGTSSPASRFAPRRRSRPASDFSIDGASADGSVIPGPVAINATNGENFAGVTFPHPYYGTEGTSEIYAFHPGGANVLMGDGSVKFLKESLPIRILARLVTRSGGEILLAEQYQ